MKRFAVVFKNLRTGFVNTRTSPMNFYAACEQEVRSHFDMNDYEILSIRECSTLV